MLCFNLCFQHVRNPVIVNFSLHSAMRWAWSTPRNVRTPFCLCPRNLKQYLIATYLLSLVCDPIRKYDGPDRNRFFREITTFYNN